jgi:hypothetical protein
MVPLLVPLLHNIPKVKIHFEALKLIFCTFVGMCLSFWVQLHLSLSANLLSCSSLTLGHEPKVKGHEKKNVSTFQGGKQHA